MNEPRRHGAGALVPALFALSSLACAAPLTCPAKGGAPWTELTSAHFVLRTDAESRDARALVARFERVWAALAFVMRRPQGAGWKLEVVRFHRHGDFFEVTGHNTTIGGYFAQQLPGDFEVRPTMVFQGSELAVEDQETFLHELSHRFLAERTAAPPRWLNEGLAVYHETLRIEGDRIVLGDIGGLDFSNRPHWWLSARGDPSMVMTTLQVPALRAPTVWDLIHTDASTFYAPSEQPKSLQYEQQTINYAASWKLVHYFLNGPHAEDRARFAAFLAAVERGERPRDAFLETSGADLSRLEKSFRQYLTQEQLSRRTVEFRPTAEAAPPAERTMSDAEVHLLWARMMPRGDRWAPVAKHHLDEALAADPRSPEVRHQRAVYFAQHNAPDEADRELQASLALRRDDPRDLFMQLAVHNIRATAAKGKEAPPPGDLVARLARTGTSAAQLWVAALYQRDAGQMEDASRSVERALAIDPLYWPCYKLRAQLLADAGKKTEALAAVERALAVLPERVSPEPLLELRRKIASTSPAPPQPSK